MNVTDSKSREKQSLEGIAAKYGHIGSPFEQGVRRAAVRSFAHILPPSPSILELGCADGYMTFLISQLAASHLVVDASPDFIRMTKEKVAAHVRFHESLFETFEPRQQFDLVVMCYILEHVEDPSALISRVRRWLKPGTGRIFAAVPNSRALSRQLGRALGVVGDLYEITPSEVEHGHRRSYDRTTLDHDLEQGGAEIVQRGGLVLKPFSTAQLDDMMEHGIIGEQHIVALDVLATELPDLAHTIYAIAK